MARGEHDTSRRGASRAGPALKGGAAKGSAPKAPAAKAPRARGRAPRAGGRGRDAVVLALCLAALVAAGWVWAVRGGSAARVDLGPIAMPEERAAPPLAPDVPPEIVRQLELDDRFIALERWTAENPTDVAGGTARWRELERLAVGTPYAELVAPRLAELEARTDAQLDTLDREVDDALRVLDWDKAETKLGELAPREGELSEAQRERLRALRTHAKAVREDYQASSFRMGIIVDPTTHRLYPYDGMRVLGADQIGLDQSKRFIVLPAGGHLALGFDLDPGDKKVYVRFNHLETLAHGLRFARMTIVVNGKVLATGIAPINGEAHVIEITRRIRRGSNVIELHGDPESLTVCWLRRLEIADRP